MRALAQAAGVTLLTGLIEPLKVAESPLRLKRTAIDAIGAVRHGDLFAALHGTFHRYLPDRIDNVRPADTLSRGGYRGRFLLEPASIWVHATSDVAAALQPSMAVVIRVRRLTIAPGGAFTASLIAGRGSLTHLYRFANWSVAVQPEPER